jgi:hypothetical protein
MVYWTSLLKNEPPLYGLNPYPWHFEPLFMVYQTPYPWYIKPPTYFLIRIWPMTYLYRIYPFFFLTQLILKNSSRTIAIFENVKLHFHDNHASLDRVQPKTIK